MIFTYVCSCLYVHKSSDYSFAGLKSHWTLRQQQKQFYNLAIDKLPTLLSISAASCKLSTARRLLITQWQTASILLLNYSCQSIENILWKDGMILMVGDLQSTHYLLTCIFSIAEFIHTSFHQCIPFLTQDQHTNLV